MTSEDLRIEDDPRQEDIALLDARLYEFNAAASGVHDGRSLAVFVREADGAIVAGLHGWTWGGTGFVQALWGREGLRGRGVGKQILAAAEAEVVPRGLQPIQREYRRY